MTRFVAVLGAMVVAAVAARFMPGVSPAEPATITPQDTTATLVALGESIYRGKVAGGLCYTCHQLNGKGMKGIAPDLTDGNWLHGDGSVAAIIATVEKGVAKPKESPVPMPPLGGSRLSTEQVRAVAVYVQSLGAPRK
jgi:mono/diheme cytochrome c family protein